MSNTIDIRRLTNGDDEWDSYVKTNEQATLYHLTAWKRIIECTFGHRTDYLVARQHERIVGI